MMNWLLLVACSGAMTRCATPTKIRTAGMRQHGTIIPGHDVISTAI
jgi:hypothetical protein